MIHIVFVVSRLGIGGLERVFHDIAIGLDREKTEYDISVICLYQCGVLGEGLSSKGVEIYYGILKNRFDIRGVFRFIDILRKKRPDVLYIAGQSAVQAISIIGSLFVKIPVKIIGIHSHDLAYRAPYKSLIDRVTFCIFKEIVCVSISQKRHIIKYKDIHPSRIKVIYNGIDVDRIRDIKPPERRSFLIPEDAVVIGTIASLRKEKGLDIFIKAMPKILKNCQTAFFIIVGDGRERLSLESMAKSLGVYTRIRFLGERGDAFSIIHIFDIACCSSRIENFPLSVLEYMSHSKPIVCTRVGGLPEMIQDGFTGLLIDKESPDSLAEKLLLLIDNKSLSKSMGLHAREYVCNNFRIDTMIDSYKKYIRTLVYENSNYYNIKR